MLDQIKWLGHGSYVIEGPPLIYIDPWRVTRKAFHADVILISHDHYDHFSMADITKLRGPDTIIIGNPSIVNQVEGATLLRPWQSMTIDKANIKAVPAYTPGSIQHPPEANGLGFIISVNLYDIYYAGDTGIIPEMEKIRPDIAILPLDGNDTLNVEDATHVIKSMRPRWVLPSNWASTADSATLMDVKELKERVQDYTDVIIPEQAK